MSAQDLSEFISENPYEESKVGDLVRRGGRSLADALRQNSLEQVVSGVMEATGAARGGRGGGGAIMREIFGGNINMSNLRAAQEGTIAISEYLGRPTGTSSSISYNISNILEAVKSGQFVNRDVLDELLSFGSGLYDEISSVGSLSSLETLTNLPSEVGSEISSADFNGDGRIDPVELAASKAGEKLYDNNGSLHPMAAYAYRNQNFMQDQFAKRKIEVERITSEKSGSRSNQVNTVMQGYARYDRDINDFNVSY